MKAIAPADIAEKALHLQKNQTNHILYAADHKQFCFIQISSRCSHLISSSETEIQSDSHQAACQKSIISKGSS